MMNVQTDIEAAEVPNRAILPNLSTTKMTMKAPMTCIRPKMIVAYFGPTEEPVACQSVKMLTKLQKSKNVVNK